MAFWQRLFGYQIPEKQEKKEQPTFVSRDLDDGATIIDDQYAYGSYLDLDGTVRNEFELITRYREMSLQPECDSAIGDICDEAIICDKNKPPVSVNLDDVEDFSEAIKNKIQEEFNVVLELLNFKNLAYETFRKWYTDGRIFYHATIDKKNPTAGIQELKYIDPRQIKKIKEVQRQTDLESGVEVVVDTNEYYLYNERGMLGQITKGSTEIGMKISPDVIIYAHSGIFDSYSHMVLSNLHKAYKAWNQLRMIEDAVIIYRLTRAPERRVFYIDVGTMPRTKAQQYLQNVMNKYRNRVTYDSNTGEVRNDKRFMTMNEDFWLPRAEGRSGTSVDTLRGGENLGEIQDIEYFQNKLYKALSVPITRQQADNVFSFGKGSAITRDELKFAKFIGRLQSKFSMLFDEILHRQLVLKNIIAEEEWSQLQSQMFYNYVSDSFYEEIKEAEMIRDRAELAEQLSSMQPRYYSDNYIRKNILKLSEEEIEAMEDDKEEEEKEREEEREEESADEDDSQDYIDQTEKVEEQFLKEYVFNTNGHNKQKESPKWLKRQSVLDMER
jgi:hypothetical protein